MVKCCDIMNFIEQIAPCELAEKWDNVGLMVGNSEHRVEKVMLCLDITNASVAESLENKTDLIVTHHPVIFRGLNRLIEDEPKGSLLYALIRNGINVYTAHTNLDNAISGINSHLAKMLGLNDIVIFGEGPGKAGILDSRMSLRDFIKHVKNVLDVPFVRLVGKADQGVQRVAVFSGSFDDNLEAVIRSQADILVTGDIRYHTALDARESGLCIVDAGHFNTEKIVLPALAKALRGNFPEVEVYCFQKEEDPFKNY